jgi:hypothetical protein
MLTRGVFPMMDARSWSVFHDGEITAVSGEVPGNLEFKIEAEYLRERFTDPGVAFRISVSGCDMLSFRSFKTNEILFGIDGLSGGDLEILSAKLEGDALAIITASGIITIRYKSEAIALDTGRTLQIADVALAAQHAVADLTKSGA